MEKQKASEILKEAVKNVDWINLGLVVSSLGEYNFPWGRYDGTKWVPEYEKAWLDCQWLFKNTDNIFSALSTLREYKQ